MAELKIIPTHVGIIMDGNGRWAKRRLLPRSLGHRSGMNNMIDLVEHARDIGVKYVTVYALSTENLKRPEDELEGLYNLLREYFNDRISKLRTSGIKVKVIGEVCRLPEDIRELLKKSEDETDGHEKLTLFVALVYGARQEIVRAVNRAVGRGERVDEESFSNLLYTGGVPDPDLIIRTGGELRLSNFLLWQAAYAELYFTDVYFPDFNAKQFDKAIAEYAKRERRFGKV